LCTQLDHAIRGNAALHDSFLPLSGILLAKMMVDDTN
jgi:hypothetical protein